jgi:CRP/FNR family cyclic AMP-dependent transcriptional regulator
MDQGALGKEFQDGEIIVRQGDVGDSMFVIQEGRVEVLREDDGQQTRLRVAEEGEFMGEMSIFERQKRSATLRALGKVRILTIDKKNFLRRIHEDPSLAFRIAQNMSSRIRELSDQIARLKHELGT